MDSILNSSNKIIYIFEKGSGFLSESVVSISIPEPVTDINGDYFCMVNFERKLVSPKKIIGIDAFHALILSIRFLETLLSATYDDFEVRDRHGEKYVTLFSF